MHRLLIALSLTACTATVRTTGTTGPTEPPPPPPPRMHPSPAPAPAPGPVVTAPPPAVPGAHPAYVSAIRHMRRARALIARSGPGAPDVKWDEAAASREIDAAIKLAHDARVDDGRPLTENPTIDNGVVYKTRLRQAVAELGSAVHDLDTAEDNAWAQDQRDAAKKHIYAALHLIEAADNKAEGHSEATPPPAPAAHPAYVAALNNLRQARALLERPAGAADVKWDEKTAIRDIDDALAEIRKARVDDGKPNTEHAPIESALMYRDRIKEAQKQLGEAAKDLDEKEDNAWAKKDRRKAVDDVRRAEKATREAMADRKDDKAEKKDEKREEKAEKKAAKGH